MKTIARAPGKLFIAGEYAVTTGLSPAIISAVPKYLTVSLKKEMTGRISSDKYSQDLHFVRDNNGRIRFEHNRYFAIVQRCIHITEQYLQEHNCFTPSLFHIHITSELDDKHTGKKYGLGSSGALSIATIKGLLSFYQHEYSPLLVYKLACLAHLSLKSHGSFGDLAASAFGGLIVYRLFDKQWVQEQWKNFSLSHVLSLEWPNLVIKPLQWPKSTYFLVGWTGSPASTEQLVADIKQTKKNVSYQQFIQNSRHCIACLESALKTGEHDKIAKYIRYNRQLLQGLSKHIETPLLRRLCHIAERYHCASKVSGAGGGDCGICLIQENEHAMIKKCWQQNGIETLFTLGGHHV
ncbi:MULTISPECIES: phosphomevalonate kinase [unclassified Granulicatella]|uniref:phosphomevalonate kinase n=1 Tax=unclassified Granulicatella TaxID=2630493 RepID=UPI001074841A|nr:MULTISPECIES: phosphomevalonate kinase [unclassified Granulicatella]MBF0780813.1 phosphomevalonate kinase [Granulicatella sp. 19428wC4_WM01]TFU93799.1 phosphomevalonate kinase [Granulicatella sp. WM01]